MSLSYVDDERDGRGWAFRERRGADPVSGFTFQAQAYEATEPGYDGHVSVPVLWDRRTGRIASNNFPDFTAMGGLRRGPKPSFLNDGEWRLKIGPRRAAWDAPHDRARLG